MKLILIAFKYLKKYPIFTGAVLFSILIASLFEGASFGMLVPLIQSMIAEGKSLLEKIPFMSHLGFSSMNQIRIISIIFAVIFMLLLVKNIFVYLSYVLIARLRFGIIRDLRINLMSNLLEYDMKYFDSAKTGHIIGSINAETERMGNFMRAVLHFVAFSGRVGAYALLLFFISWKVSIVIFLLIATVLIPIELIMKKIKIISGYISQAIAEYSHKLTEILSGIRLIKGCGTQESEKKDFKSKADRVYRFLYKGNIYAYLIIPLSEIFIFGLIIVCFVILVNATKINIKDAFPFIAVYLLVLGKMLTQLNTLNNSRSMAVNEIAAFARYEEIYDEKGKKTIKSGNKKLKKFSDSIVFKNVNFSYVPGRQILKNINIEIPKGKVTALVGASGVGKSTIVNLISRFYDINSGMILIDGINLRDLALEEWRRKIGFVSQEVFIFNTDVKSNISYGRPHVTEEGIIKAAKTANAHDFIMNLPDKYDTILGERGVKLSGGQKQRVSIARAIIHNPQILILDEATSSLDTKTERLITEAIDRLTKERTVIAIAHRLSTILHADNIIVLDKGTVVEVGKHPDLVKENGAYKRLYDAQFST